MAALSSWPTPHFRQSVVTEGNHMIAFTGAEVEEFLSRDDGQSVVMLNLLRFRPDGGRERYLRYLNMAQRLVARYHAEIIFAGDGAIP